MRGTFDYCTFDCLNLSIYLLVPSQSGLNARRSSHEAKSICLAPIFFVTSTNGVEYRSLPVSQVAFAALNRQCHRCILSFSANMDTTGRFEIAEKLAEHKCMVRRFSTSRLPLCSSNHFDRVGRLPQVLRPQGLRGFWCVRVRARQRHYAVMTSAPYSGGST